MARRTIVPANESVPESVIEAERAVLCAILLDAACIPSARAIIGPEAFWRAPHSRIYRAALALESRGADVDMITVVEELRREGELEQVGGPSTVAELGQLAGTRANVEAHARIVAEHHARREARRAGLALIEGTHNGADLGALVLDCQNALAAAEKLRAPDLSRPPALIDQVMSSEQLFAVEDAAPDVVGHRFMVEGGFTVMAGLAGFGKTFFGLQLLRGVGDGTPVLGMYAVKGRGGMLQLEMPSFAIRERLKTPPPGLEWLCQPSGFRELSDPRTTDDITRWCEKSKLKLLVADPLAYLQRRDENAAVELDPFIDAVNRIRRRTGTHVMVLHHVNKITFDKQASLRTNVMLAVRGSTRLTAEPDNVLGLVQRNGRVMLVNAKTRLCASPEFYCVRQLPQGDPNEGFFELADTPAEVADATDARILKALAVMGEKGATVDDLMRMTECTRTTVQRHLDNLAVTVLTETRGKKRYFLDEESPQREVDF